ncbi:MAG TPA: polyprenyl synthetase family protein, partial [Bacteroidales bacterium]|nr:polyprenyl synthetase family protein [Bacteroidales bacterium]
MHNYEDLYKKFKLALSQESFSGKPSELYEPIEYMMDLGGKRIRPVLLLLACDAFGGNVDEAIPAALAMEMFHNFTLVHDDIMDGAEIRRGKDTIWNIWGEDTAILVGDTMFSLAVEYLNRIENPRRKEIMDAFLIASRQVCEG